MGMKGEKDGYVYHQFNSNDIIYELSVAEKQRTNGNIVTPSCYF